jgi:hypothetical protein
MPTEPVIDVLKSFEGQTHIEWATEKAAAEAHKRGFRSGTHEEAELIAAALLILCKRATTFQPDRVPEGGSADGLFRGWVARSLKFELWKTTLRLRCGGAYHSIPDEKEKQGIRATGLPTHVNELGEEEVWVEDYREEPSEIEPVREAAAVVEVRAVLVMPARPPASWLECPACGNRVKLRAGEPRQCVRGCRAALVSAA